VHRGQNLRLVVVAAEADAITKAANRLESEQVERAVELLANCQGKVVTSGSRKVNSST